VTLSGGLALAGAGVQDPLRIVNYMFSDFVSELPVLQPFGDLGKRLIRK
jgi:hypothetical protein